MRHEPVKVHYRGKGMLEAGEADGDLSCSSKKLQIVRIDHEANLACCF